VIPRDADILLDHRAIVIDRGIAHVGEGRVRGSDRRPRHGDSAIAAALAHFASRMDAAMVAYEPVMRPRCAMFAAAAEAGADDDMRLPGPRVRFGRGAW